MEVADERLPGQIGCHHPFGAPRRAARTAEACERVAPGTELRSEAIDISDPIFEVERVGTHSIDTNECANLGAQDSKLRDLVRERTVEEQDRIAGAGRVVQGCGNRLLSPSSALFNGRG